MSIKLLSIDLAKQKFQIQGVDDSHQVVQKKSIARNKLSSFVARLKPCTIAMEACGGAHYWARLFESMGHEVKMMSPQHVKPFVMTNKNDPNDADGISVAAQRPSMRFVPTKSVEQQDIQALHRIRSRLVEQRTQLVNQLRGILTEYGIVFSRQISHVNKMIPRILEDANNELSVFARQFVRELFDEFRYFNDKVTYYDKQIITIFKQNKACQRIGEIEGIGPLTATAIVASIGDGKGFNNGRELSAWLGLVPRQSSSGNRQQLLGISKRGDRYLRTLLIHGGRSVVNYASKKTDDRSEWINALKCRRGANIASVAVANKNARIIWAVLSKEEEYRKAA